MYIVAQILNMKDALMQQILTALLYKKTVIWTDLKINPGGSRDNDVIYAPEKVV
jgi:predicted ATP-dependent protease